MHRREHRREETLNLVPDGLHCTAQASCLLLDPGEYILPYFLQALQQPLEEPRYPVVQALLRLLVPWTLNFQGVLPDSTT